MDQAGMAKVERYTLNQQVYQHLQQMVLSGDLTPGEQLDERALAEGLGVSRTPLREAINQLVKEGIIEYEPYRGNFVRTFTIKQVNDLFQVRKSLESLAVRLAVPKLSQEDLGRIRTILAEVDEALQQGDLEAYSDADRRFHKLIIDKTGNETLIETLDRLGLQFQLIRIFANRDPGVVERTAQERPRILTALAAFDADKAASLMEAHIEGVRQAVIAHLEDSELDEGLI
jgi:DNA-binding GntR family transcriptional regulator